MTQLLRLEEWYRAQCDDEWEHAYGVKIEPLDNPGWLIEIDLVGTALDGVFFDPVDRGDADEDVDWIDCYVTDGKFRGAGGARNLTEIIDVFVRWSEEAR